MLFNIILQKDSLEEWTYQKLPLAATQTSLKKILGWDAHKHSNSLFFEID